MTNPILVIDSHYGEPISNLFLASERYLISVSEDGTATVTDLLDREIEIKFDAVRRRK